MLSAQGGRELPGNLANSYNHNAEFSNAVEFTTIFYKICGFEVNLKQVSSCFYQLAGNLCIKDINAILPTQYQLYKSKIIRNDGYKKGAAMLVPKSVQHEKRALRTTLQAVAVSFFIGKLYTVCSVYLPHHAIQSNEIRDLINQLPRPWIIQGNFNAKSFLRGDTIEYARRRIIEEISLSN